MAVIVFDEGVHVIKGSKRGITFDICQAGNYAKKRPSPINSQTGPRMELRRNLKEANEFFWNLNPGQKLAWRIYGSNVGIDGPYGDQGDRKGCAAFFSCALNSAAAGDGFPPAPGAIPPIAAPTVTALARIDTNTVRATFNPSPAGADKRIYLRQALPGPGVRRWAPVDGYIAEYSALNPNSTFDFTTKFPHLLGWNCRYWVGFQNTFGGRATETLFEL